MRRLILLGWLVLAAAMALPASDGWAQNGAGLLQKRLDTPFSMDVDDKPITEVFWKLARETHVRFNVAEETLALLPYGEQTHMRVRIQDATLRSALPQLLRPQGLAWQIVGDVVHIIPSEPLDRLGRRATFDELVMLGRLMSVELPAAASEVTPLEMLRHAADAQDLKLILPDALLGPAGQTAQQRANQVLPGTAAAWLDEFTGPSFTWYLGGDRVTVLPRSDQVRRQLRRKVSLRYENTRLVKVLLDLAAQGRVKLSMTPGVLNTLPADVRSSFTLMMDEATIAQALEVISGATGLEFAVTDEGIDARPSLLLQVRTSADASVDSASQSVEDPSSSARPRRRAGLILSTRFVGSDGVERELLIPMFDLPEDILQNIEAYRGSALQEMRHHWVVPADAAAADDEDDDDEDGEDVGPGRKAIQKAKDAAVKKMTNETP